MGNSDYRTPNSADAWEDEAGAPWLEDPETQALLDREVGPDVAGDACETKLQLNMLCVKYKQGDRLAPVQAFLLCYQRNAFVPRWVVEALGPGFERYLTLGPSELDLDRAMFPPTGEGRSLRFRDPREESAVRARWALMHDLMSAAELAGYTGAAKLNIVYGLLAELGEARGEDTLRQYRSRRKLRIFENDSGLQVVVARLLLRRKQEIHTETLLDLLTAPNPDPQ
jgi:hypothetical protein